MYAHLYIYLIQLNPMNDYTLFNSIQDQHIFSKDKNHISCFHAVFVDAWALRSCLLSTEEGLSILISCFSIWLGALGHLLFFKSFFFFKKKRFMGYKKLLTFSNWWCRSSSLDCYMEAENNLEHAILAYLWLICLFSCWILIIAFYSFIFNM